MKKEIALCIVIVFISFGCKTNQKTEYTILGEYTPIGNWLIEKLNGKVEKLTEKYYWGVAEGENVRKGNMITSKEADSVGFGYICELNFDAEGNLVSNKNYSENYEYIGGWQFFQKNNRPDSVQRIWKDTIRSYDRLEYNGQGLLIKVSGYNANTDTLMYTWTKTISKNGDSTEYLVCNNKGDLTWRLLHLFDKQGVFIGFESYGPDGTMRGSNKIIYNDNGNASEVTFFDGSRKPTNVMKRVYEYDSKGNWIKLTATNDKGGMNVHERTITYFE
jgi:hypothetical protein